MEQQPTLWAPAAHADIRPSVPADPVTQIAAALATLRRSSQGLPRGLMDYTDLRVFAERVAAILDTQPA